MADDETAKDGAVDKQRPQVGGFRSFDAQGFLQAQQRQKEEQDAKIHAALADLLSSSSSDEDDEQQPSSDDNKSSPLAEGSKRKRDDGTKKKKKDKKQKKRHKHDKKSTLERERIIELERRHGPEQRASHVPNWASTSPSGSQQPTVPFYFDRRGDLGNVAFGALYKMDVAMYKRHDPTGFAPALLKNNKQLLASSSGNNTSKPIKKWDKSGAVFRTSTSFPRDHYGFNRELDDDENDLQVQQSSGGGKNTTRRRYFSPAVVRAERNKSLRRWRRYEQPSPQQSSGRGESVSFLALDPSKDELALNDNDDALTAGRVYIPGTSAKAQFERLEQQINAATLIKETKEDDDVPSHAAARGETSEEYIYRRTREFNQLTREQPEIVATWLEFAAFQDEALKMSVKRKGAEKATTEKKIAILEQALTYHPDSEEILLALLDSAKNVLESNELGLRWRRILAVHSNSPTLWKAYLKHQKTAFSEFQATDIAQTYRHALTALKRSLDTLKQQQNTEDKNSNLGINESITQLEEEIVGIALEGIAFQLESGHTEAGIAAIQVAIDFHWFAPEDWPKDALEMMFEECWRSGAPLVGSAGSKGWAAWLEGASSSAPPAAPKSEKAAVVDEQMVEKEKPDSDTKNVEEQSGWVELTANIRARFGHGLAFDDGLTGGEGDRQKTEEGEEKKDSSSASSDDEDKEDKEEAVKEEETDEQLLARLGMDLDETLAQEEQLTPEVLTTWLDMEHSRQADQWQAHRNNAAVQNIPNEDSPVLEPHALVTWDDVQPWAVGLDSVSARTHLLFGCLQLLGVSDGLVSQSGTGTGDLNDGPLPSNTPAASGLDGMGDEIYSGVEMLGLQNNENNSSASEYDILSGGDWAWLLPLFLAANPNNEKERNGRYTSTTVDHSSSSSSLPSSDSLLRVKPWYKESTDRRDFVLNILRCCIEQQTPALLNTNASLVKAAVLLVSETDCIDKSNGAEQQSTRDWTAAKTFIQELLAKQRDNLVLWKAYAEIELCNGNTKAAKKVYYTCLQTAVAPVLGAIGLGALVVDKVVHLDLLQVSKGGAPPREIKNNVPMLIQQALACTTSSRLSALRTLAWFGSNGSIPLPPSKGQVPELEQEDIITARKGYQDALLKILHSGSGHTTSDDVAIVQAAAAFEQLAAVVLGKGEYVGLKAAVLIYDQIVNGLLTGFEKPPLNATTTSITSNNSNSTIGCTNAYVERLCIQRSLLLVSVSTHYPGVVSPATARKALETSLKWFPSSSSLLQMVLRFDLQSHAMSYLRRTVTIHCRNYPSLVQCWLAAVAVEVAGQSPGRAVVEIFERAVNNTRQHESETKVVCTSCPLVWRWYMRFEAYRGRYEAVRRIFLRAVNSCPWSKALWVDGLALLNEHATPKELTDYLAIMKNKELVVRTDVLEVLLARMEADDD